MLNIDTSIITLYEKENVPIEDIAEGLGLTSDQVKLSLAQYSSKFRKLAKQDDTLFDDSVLALARNKMVELATQSSNEGIAYRACKFIINENKGRHDVDKVKGAQINILSINEQMREAVDTINRSKAKHNMKEVVDIPSENVVVA
jgi:hypothetical protein